MPLRSQRAVPRRGRQALAAAIASSRQTLEDDGINAPSRTILNNTPSYNGTTRALRKGAGEEQKERSKLLFYDEEEDEDEEPAKPVSSI